jgi:tetratricopeptide (TPR) repeat protein
MRWAALFLLLLSPALARAGAAPEGPRSADRLFDAGKYRDAADRYTLLVEDAGSGRTEEAAMALYNKASALYRLGEFALARDSFEQAAVKSRRIDVEARATYNLGNCAYREAEAAIARGNLQQAVQSLEASIAAYRRSLELGPERTSAASNLEVARTALKGVRDELAKYGDLQALQKEILQTLQKLIARQGGIVQSSRDPDVSTAVLRDGQVTLDRDTVALLGRFDALLERLARLQGGADSANPYTEARTHVQSSEGHQKKAIGHLASGDRQKALPAETASLEELQKALEILTPPEREDRSEQGKSEQDSGGGKDSAPQEQGTDKGSSSPQPGDERQDQSDKDKGASAGSGSSGAVGALERAEDILQEEGEKRRLRDARTQGADTRVDKDW